MSNPQTNPRAAALNVALAVAFAIATLLLAFYIVPAGSRGLPFGLSLANLVLGELLLGAELARAANSASKSRVFIAALGGVMGPVLYLAAAVALALLAWAGAPEKLLVVLHVLLLLAAVSGLVLFSIAGEAAEKATGGSSPVNGFLDDLKGSARQLADRAAALPSAAGSVHSALRSVHEEVRFTYAGSDAKSSADDEELRRELAAMDAAVGALLANPSDTAATEAILRSASRFRLALARRNDGLKSRR